MAQLRVSKVSAAPQAKLSKIKVRFLRDLPTLISKSESLLQKCWLWSMRRELTRPESNQRKRSTLLLTWDLRRPELSEEDLLRTKEQESLLKP